VNSPSPYMNFPFGVIAGAIGTFVVLAAWQKNSPATYPFDPLGDIAYMAPRTLAPNSPNVILVPAANSDAARGDVLLLCNGSEQWQDEGVDPVNHRWCKPL